MTTNCVFIYQLRYNCASLNKAHVLFSLVLGYSHIPFWWVLLHYLYYSLLDFHWYMCWRVLFSTLYLFSSFLILSFFLSLSAFWGHFLVAISTSLTLLPSLSLFCYLSTHLILETNFSVFYNLIFLIFLFFLSYCPIFIMVSIPSSSLLNILSILIFFHIILLSLIFGIWIFLLCLLFYQCKFTFCAFVFTDGFVHVLIFFFPATVPSDLDCGKSLCKILLHLLLLRPWESQWH